MVKKLNKFCEGIPLNSNILLLDLVIFGIEIKEGGVGGSFLIGVMEGGLLLFDCCNKCIIDKATTKVSGLLNHIVKILAQERFV